MNINDSNMKYASAGIWTRGTSLASSRVARLHHTRFKSKIQQGIYILTSSVCRMVFQIMDMRKCSITIETGIVILSSATLFDMDSANVPPNA